MQTAAPANRIAAMDDTDLFLGLGFVDRILALDGPRITAQKNLTITEDFLLDHFPRYPVMPGVLMIQSVVETAGWWLKHHLNFKASGMRLKEARNVRFANFLTDRKSTRLNSSHDV